MSELARVSVSLERGLLRRFDRFRREAGYPTRSEAVKDVIRRRMVEKEWKTGRYVAGAVAVVYDHHRPGLMHRLTRIQHDFTGIIVATQHVHLDHDNCLEFIIVRGRAAEIRSLVRRLRSVKGLKHSEILMTTTGGGAR